MRKARTDRPSPIQAATVSGRRETTEARGEVLDFLESRIELSEPPQPSESRSVLLLDGRPLLRSETIATLYGQSGTKKTFLALDIALTVAHGGKSLAGYSSVKPNGDRVCYVAGEGKGDLPKRIAAARERRDLPTDNSNLLILGKPVLLGNGVTWEHLAKAVLDDKGRYPALIIIDTLSANAKGGIDMDTNKGAKQVMDDLRSLANKTGACVLVIHHTGWTAKGKKSHERGGSTFRCDGDTSIQVTEVTGNHKSRNSDLVELTCEKQRDEKEFEAFRVAFEQQEVGRGYGESINGKFMDGSNVSLVCVPVAKGSPAPGENSGIVADDIQKRLGDALRELQVEGGEKNQSCLAKELRGRLGVSVSKATRLLQGSHLKKRKVGKEWLYDLSCQSSA